MIESAKSDGMEPVSYEPLKRLKASMKRRMVELAQMSCKKTRILIGKWFDEGAYQQQLIMQELGPRPDI